MVLALVLLPALAGILGGDSKGAAGQLGGDDLLLTLTLTFGKVAVFLVLVLVVGTRVVPWLLSQVARTGSREPFTLSVLAAALVSPSIRRRCSESPLRLALFFTGVVLMSSRARLRVFAEILVVVSCPRRFQRA